MGLLIHSLGELPSYVKRGYYIYLLDYGWHEPLGEALNKNFATMSSIASQHDAVVLKGIVAEHFTDEVLSWHSINGQEAKKLLPAILITRISPNEFKEHHLTDSPDNRLLFIPLQETCKTTTDVANLISQIFADIKDRKALSDFEITREFKLGKYGAVVDALELKPNIAGVGINLNQIIGNFLKKK